MTILAIAKLVGITFTMTCLMCWLLLSSALHPVLSVLGMLTGSLLISLIGVSLLEDEP